MDDETRMHAARSLIEDSDDEHRAHFAASRRATASIRMLIAEMRERTVSVAEFDRLAVQVETLTESIAALPRSPRYVDRPFEIGDELSRLRYEYGLNGRSTVARPDFSVHLDNGSLQGQVTFGPLNEGAVPGVATGPWIAYIFDLVLVGCTAGATWAAVTRQLDIRYRKPVPVGIPLAIYARIDSVESRRFSTSGEIRLGEDVLADARAVMVDVTGRAVVNAD